VGLAGAKVLGEGRGDEETEQDNENSTHDGQRFSEANKTLLNQTEIKSIFGLPRYEIL
jgi:hypothetical protein